MLKINVDYGEGQPRAFLSNVAYGIIGFALLGLWIPATVVATGLAAYATVLVMLLTAFLNVVYA